MNENNGVNLKKRSVVQNTETIDLLELGRKLFIPKTAFTIIIAGLLVGIFTFLYSKFMIPEMFTSSAMVYVSNSSSIIISDEAERQTFSDNRILAQSGLVILQSDYVMEEIGSALMDMYPISELEENFALYKALDGETKIKSSSIASCFTIESKDNTEVILITAVTKNARLSADMCNILVNMAPDLIKNIVGGGTVETIGIAHPALQNSSPDKLNNVLMSFFVTAATVLWFLILNILMDRKIRNSESLKSEFDFPVFNEIPYIYIENKEKKKGRFEKNLKNSDNDILDGVDSEQSFRLTEIFNALANSLAVTLTMNDEKIVVISSSDENDGKSTVSVNVAKSMAKLGKKVLLMDLDLRKGTIHKKINIANKNGVIDIIGKDVNFDRCIKKNVLDGLDVLLTGGTLPNSTNILSSKKMHELIEKCRERYEVIIIDSPPVNAVGDACVIAKCADAGMLIVVKANQTYYSDVSRLIENVRYANGKIIGFIINFA